MIRAKALAVARRFIQTGGDYFRTRPSSEPIVPILRLLALCLLSSFVPIQAEADLSYDIRDDVRFGRVITVVIGGAITREDRDALLATRDTAATADLRMAILGSDGGDLDAAMEMGRYLRAMDFTTIVLPDMVCYSACVFLLAGGVDKKVQGHVGIHRPYFTIGPAGSVAEAIKTIKSEAEAYFEEMNIPGRLAEDMFSIEPANMRVLSDTELRDYRLNSKDYAAQEADTIGMADRLGVSREAYEAFRQDLNYSCQIYMGRPEHLTACMREVSARHNIPMPPDMAQ